MNNIKVTIAVLAALLTMSCGGGSSSGGPLTAGPTTHAGTWELIAKIRVVLGGTAGGDSAGTVTDLVHTSTVLVKLDGRVTIQSTDSTCAVAIAVNGDTMTYQEQCIFAGSNPVACTLTMRSNASFIKSSTVSGAFGPKTLICSGNATSYSGNLTGNLM